MAENRYPQFCALARATEILGERWTLLIVRELLLGPKRFADLRERLDSVSTSVLAERLARLGKSGLVQRTVLEPPAASTVYELTDLGRGLEPVVHGLIRWGARFMLPRRPGERIEADWLRLALAACARSSPTPPRSFDVRITDGRREVALRVEGGPSGTAVRDARDEAAPANATLIADPEIILGLMAGVVTPADALSQGRLRAEGDETALAQFAQLFDATVGGGRHAGT